MDVESLLQSVIRFSNFMTSRLIVAGVFFYVLAGQATLEIEGQVHQLQVGEGLHVPAGAAHRLSNLHADSLELLVVSTPPSHGDRELAPC